MLQPRPGLVIAEKYELVAELGVGGQGEVWRAVRRSFEDLRRRAWRWRWRCGADDVRPAEHPGGRRYVASPHSWGEALSPGSRGADDVHGADEWTLDEHLELLRETRGCKGEAEVTRTDGEPICKRWPCDAELSVCFLDGGRPWPGLNSRVPCENEAPDFDVTATIFAFFQRHLVK